MGYIRRTWTNKGRGQPRERCPKCNKKGLGPLKAITIAQRPPIVAKTCRYCGHWKMITDILKL